MATTNEERIIITGTQTDKTYHEFNCSYEYRVWCRYAASTTDTFNLKELIVHKSVAKELSSKYIDEEVWVELSRELAIGIKEAHPNAALIPCPDVLGNTPLITIPQEDAFVVAGRYGMGVLRSPP